jgi:hypothetical protein
MALQSVFNMMERKGGITMVALRLENYEDVRRARACAQDLAQAAGLEDPAAVAMATSELGNNCVEHGQVSPGLLRIGCGPGRLSLQFENSCERKPSWCSRKPIAVGQFRTGGYGLPIVRALARTVNCRWTRGRVVVRAEFS